jgi:hypothetical protein
MKIPTINIAILVAWYFFIYRKNRVKISETPYDRTTQLCTGLSTISQEMCRTEELIVEGGMFISIFPKFSRLKLKLS